MAARDMTLWSGVGERIAHSVDTWSRKSEKFEKSVLFFHKPYLEHNKLKPTIGNYNLQGIAFQKFLDVEESEGQCCFSNTVQ